MLQSLDVISVNILQILISLANLVILFLIVKRFLYKPVKKVLEARKKAIADQYSDADAALKNAIDAKKTWAKKVADAEDEAEAIVADATRKANQRAVDLVAQAQNKAIQIEKQAEQEAKLSYRKAEAQMKEEMVSISAALTEKLIGRELKEDDHRALIDSFIDEIGGENDADR